MQHECRSSYYAGECVDDAAHIAEVTLGGAWSIGSVQARDIVAHNSQEYPSARAPASPPRASSARSARSVGAAGLGSGLLRVAYSSNAKQHSAPTLGDLKGGWRKVPRAGVEGPTSGFPKAAFSSSAEQLSAPMWW